MVVNLSPEIHEKLVRLAAEQGRDAQELAREAITRFVDYDNWFIEQVERGLESADRGELLSHEQVGTRVEKLITEKQSRS